MRTVVERLAATERTVVVGDVDASVRDRLAPFLTAHNVGLEVDGLVPPDRCALVRGGERVAESPLEPVVRYVTEAWDDTDGGAGPAADTDDPPRAARDASGGAAVLGARPAVVDEVFGTDSAVRSASIGEMLRLSREVERRAWRAGSGRLRSGFQELSTIAGAGSTREEYGRLDAAGVDVVVYGAPDGDGHEPDDFAFPVVVDEAGAVADYWFVLFDGGDDERRAAALVCRDDGDREYTGYWTRSPDLVAECFDLAAAEHPGLFAPP